MASAEKNKMGKFAAKGQGIKVDIMWFDVM
jgi:hypothetical protein